MTNKTYTTIGNIFTGIINLILIYLIVASYVDAYKATTDQDIINAITVSLVGMVVVLLVESLWFLAWLRHNRRQARFRVFGDYSQRLR